MVDEPNSYTHVSGVSIACLKGSNTGPILTQGKLHLVSVNTANAASILTLYDGTNTGAPVIAIIDCSVNGTHIFDAQFINGLTYNMSGANSDVTIVWR